MSKQLEIAQQVMNTATVITDLAKQLPKTGKRRNIFIKTYNRRPQNKKKRGAIIAQMALTSVMGAMQVARIASQPIPKFAKGSTP